MATSPQFNPDVPYQPVAAGPAPVVNANAPASVPAFDPSAPYKTSIEATAPAFDPTAPYTAAVPQTQTPSVWGRIAAFATHPLVSAGTIEASFHGLGEDLGQGEVGKVVRGVGEAGAEGLSGFTSPLSIGLTLATGGLGLAEGGAEGLAAKLGLSSATWGTISRLANLGFSSDAIYHAAKNFPEIYKAIKSGDAEGAAKGIASNIANVGLAGWTFAHALGDVAPGAAKEPDARVVANDAAKIEAQQPVQAPANPFRPAPATPPTPEPEQPTATNRSGEKFNVAKTVTPGNEPIVTQTEVLSEATQRMIDNSAALHGILDPSKINSAEDVEAALKEASSVIEQNLDPRVGTRIGLDAQKQLAADLGMTLDELAERKSGTAFNAEQAVAARAMLRQSADNIVALAKAAAAGDENAQGELAVAMAKHQEIRNAVLGAASEAGRALGSFRIPDEELPQLKIASAMSQLTGKPLAEAAKLLSRLDPTAPNYMRRANELVAEITPSTTADKMFEIYRNGLLSGPATVIKKTTSEAMMMALTGAQKFLVGALVQVKRILGRSAGIEDLENKAYPSEAFFYARGAAQALTHLPAILKDEFSLEDAPDFEPTGQHAIKGTLGQIVRAPGTLLSRLTNAVYIMNYFGELNAQAVRQAISEGLEGEGLAARQDYLAHNPTKAMIAAADAMGKNNTFQSKLPPGWAKWQMALQGNRVGKFLFPFFKTPVNLVKQAANFSPIGVLQGTAQGDLEQQAKGLLGSSIAAAIGYLAANGTITGGGPVNFGKRQTFEATGWQPYSVKVGDHYYSYHLAEPLGLVLSSVADVVHGIAHDEGPAATTSKTENAVSHIARNVEDFPFLMQLSGLFDALTHLGSGSAPERIVDNLLASVVVPAGVKDVAQTMDTTQRSPEHEGLQNPLVGLWQTVEQRVPGLTKNVPAEMNVTGAPVRRPASSLGGANPFPVSTAKPNYVVSELARLGVPAVTAPTQINTFRDGEPIAIQVPPEVGQKIAHDAEDWFYQMISERINDPSWQTLPDTTKNTIIKRIRVAALQATKDRWLVSQQGNQ